MHLQPVRFVAPVAGHLGAHTLRAALALRLVPRSPRTRRGDQGLPTTLYSRSVVATVAVNIDIRGPSVPRPDFEFLPNYRMELIGYPGGVVGMFW